MWEEKGSTKLILSNKDSDKTYQCLNYDDSEGIVIGSFSQSQCERQEMINMTSTGPCTLALTGAGTRNTQIDTVLIVLLGFHACI